MQKKIKTKILASIWVLFVTLLTSTIVLGILSETIDFLYMANGDWTHILSIGVFGSIFAFFTYGIIIWPPVLLFIFLIEIITVKKNTTQKELKQIFVIEWLFIAMPFVMWAITENYMQWFFFLAILALGFYLRLKTIDLKE